MQPSWLQHSTSSQVHSIVPSHGRGNVSASQQYHHHHHHHHASSSASTPAAPVDVCNLFVGRLPPNVDDSALHQLFSKYGQVASCKVMLNLHTGHSKGIGFVKFHNPQDAQRAVDNLNGTMHDEHILEVRIADAGAAYQPVNPTNRIFIRNIPGALPQERLRQHLAQYGEVVDITTIRDPYPSPAGDSQVMIFATFSSTDAASRAVAAVHQSNPFPEMSTIPWLAKIAEDVASRSERLARRNRLHGASSSHNAQQHAATHNHAHHHHHHHHHQHSGPPATSSHHQHQHQPPQQPYHIVQQQQQPYSAASSPFQQPYYHPPPPPPHHHVQHPSYSYPQQPAHPSQYQPSYSYAPQFQQQSFVEDLNHHHHPPQQAQGQHGHAFGVVPLQNFMVPLIMSAPAGPQTSLVAVMSAPGTPSSAASPTVVQQNAGGPSGATPPTALSVVIPTATWSYGGGRGQQQQLIVATTAGPQSAGTPPAASAGTVFVDPVTGAIIASQPNIDYPTSAGHR